MSRLFFVYLRDSKVRNLPKKLLTFHFLEDSLHYKPGSYIKLPGLFRY